MNHSSEPHQEVGLDLPCSSACIIALKQIMLQCLFTLQTAESRAALPNNSSPVSLMLLSCGRTGLVSHDYTS